MKNIFYIMMVLVVYTACKKTNETPAVPPGEKVPSTDSAPVKWMGDFSYGPHGTVTGPASVYLQGWKIYTGPG